MLRNGIIVLLLSVVVLIGCTAAQNTPVSGDIPAPGGPSGESVVTDSHPGPVCWGIWEVTIDPVAGTFEIVPLRHADFAANVTMFLQEPAGSTTFFMLNDMVIDLDSQPGFIIIDVDVGLRHPFPGLDQFTGFDVRGVFMHDGEYTSAEDSSATYAGPSVPRLLNPDGYTRWMNWSEFPTYGVLGYTEGALGTPGLDPDATLNPYRYFASGLDAEVNVEDFFADPSNIENRGCFRTGDANFRHYQMIWPGTVVTFQYAVVASWEPPDPSPPIKIPDDFSISANCAEAFHLAISDNGSTAYYEDPSTHGGDLHLNLEVFDWGVLSNGTAIADEIGSITFESPGGMIASPVTLDPATLTASPGTAVSSVFQIDILGVDPTGLEGQTVLCRVTSAIHDSYDYGFGVPVPDAPLATYLVYDQHILDMDPSNKPTAVAEACDCLWIAPGGSVTFDGTQSFSPNGAITDWEWDFDGDGTFGDSHAGPPEHPTHTYATAGDYDVNLRVTDVASQTDTLDPGEILEVHVGSFTPPTADAFISPTIGFIDFEGDFEGSGSTGTIDLYEWDFEGDCIWDYQHPTIGDTTHAYTVPDIYDAILRVTGNGCDSVTTPVRMIEPLGILENGNFWDGQWGAWTHGHGGIPVTYIEELVPDPIFRHKVHFYRCCTNDGGWTWIRQDLDCDVTSFDELYYNLFFYIDYDELYGDGWMIGEMALAAKITYEDAAQNSWDAWFGWDTAFDGTWQWDTYWLPPYVTYHSQEVAAADTWHEKKTIDLMTINPPPAKITRVIIASWGWDWETYVGLNWFSDE